MSTDELPIFPLSSVVLFPGVQTPLHLFEPRYRQLGEAVVAGSRRLGMVVVAPEHADQMQGNPPVYPIGCGGDVVQAQRLPDGRFNIAIAGTGRFRIVSEAPLSAPRLYRIAEIEWLEDLYPENARQRVSELREHIVAQVRELAGRADPERGSRVATDLFREADDASFVNSLCNALSFAPSEKQGLLEATSIPERFERLDGLLEFYRADLGRGAAGSPTLH